MSRNNNNSNDKDILFSNDYKATPPGGFRYRKREDIVKGALTLLADNGPSTPTAILYTQEITFAQATLTIKYMRDKGLVSVLPVTDKLRERYNLSPNVRSLIVITNKGKKYLELLKGLETMLVLSPSPKSLKHGGNRGIPPDEQGKATRIRNLAKDKGLLKSSTAEAWG